MFLCRGPEPLVPPGPPNHPLELGVGLNAATVWNHFNELDAGGLGDCAFTAYGASRKHGTTGPGPMPSAGPGNESQGTLRFLLYNWMKANTDFAAAPHAQLDQTRYNGETGETEKITTNNMT